MTALKVEIPDKLLFLFTPKRYKAAKGGRGSGKSWSFARALLTIGRSKKIRVLCAREVQKSIKDSVHKLLKDQIALMGLGNFYQVFNTEIKGRNGTEFSFSGLSDQTVDSIKSFEGCDYCWVEEGQSVTSRSWGVLLPTIRKDGSEIWVSYNPDLETDATHQLFAVNTPDDCIIVTMNYVDNPWFNDVLEKERLRCLKYMPDDYDNIWLGKCRPAAVGAIYYKEMESALADHRICNVPYDPMLKVHVVYDIGWRDSMSVSMVQQGVSDIRIIDYFENSQKTIEWYSNKLKERGYNWGKVFLPHDGFSKGVKTGKSCADFLELWGWDVVEREDIYETGVEDGIKITRLTFPRIYIDKTKGERLVECLKRYRRKVNTSGEDGAPVHDEYSHGADCFRYICLNADQMTNKEREAPPMMLTGQRAY